jgi:hypothetical protein
MSVRKRPITASVVSPTEAKPVVMDFSSPQKVEVPKGLEERLKRNVNHGKVERREYTKEELRERKRELLQKARSNVQMIISKRDENEVSIERKITPSFMNEDAYDLGAQPYT